MFLLKADLQEEIVLFLNVASSGKWRVNSEQWRVKSEQWRVSSEQGNEGVSNR